MEELETQSTEIESGENTGAAPDASSDAGNSGEPAPKAAAPTEPQIDWSKAFEHPRFKELIEQKNQALSTSKEWEKRFADLEAKYSQVPKPVSKEQTQMEKLVQELEGINPALASFVKSGYESQSTIQKLQEELKQFQEQSAEQQRQQHIKEAVGKISQLHESNKLSPELKQLMNMQLDLLWRDGKLTGQNLDTEYSRILGDYNKMFEARDRAARESYLADKKKDAQVPTSQPKGAPAKPAPKKFDAPKDRETRNAEIANLFVKQMRAERDSSPV